MGLLNIEEQKNLNLIAIQYKKVIEAFKKRSDVQNGNALGYRKNQNPTGDLPFKNWPKTIGQGLTTTGFCVTASQALLLDNVFQTLLLSRNAQAKLISIDIKEQHYGITYNGNQNKWHTAILVNDSNINFIIDLTCTQFGNKFVGKDIWAFETWEHTFRSANDKHVLNDFNGNVLTTFATPDFNTYSKAKFYEVANNLHDITTINENERLLLAEFLLNKIHPINHKINLGNINTMDYKYIETINNLIQELPMQKFDENVKQYFIMKFSNKYVLKEWIKNFISGDFNNKIYMLTTNSIEDACKFASIDDKNLNFETTSDYTEHYLIFELHEAYGFNVNYMNNGNNILIPIGHKFVCDIEKDIYNAGQLEINEYVKKNTNTIYIKCNS